MSKNIKSYNDKRQSHGYWEVYWGDGKLRFKGNYVNGKRHGCWEHYYHNGQLEYKGNYVNDDRHGYWEVYHYNGDVFYNGYYDMGKKVDYEVVIDTPSKEMFPIY
jgi:antitoxin component YwqK of YwqJK toxin-antitoxin module